jgi:hypothetical protein
MRQYRIYERRIGNPGTSYEYYAVPAGFSFLGFFFNIFWFLFNVIRHGLIPYLIIIIGGVVIATVIFSFLVISFFDVFFNIDIIALVTDPVFILVIIMLLPLIFGIFGNYLIKIMHERQGDYYMVVIPASSKSLAVETYKQKAKKNEYGQWRVSDVSSI